MGVTNQTLANYVGEAYDDYKRSSTKGIDSQSGKQANGINSMGHNPHSKFNKLQHPSRGSGLPPTGGSLTGMQLRSSRHKDSSRILNNYEQGESNDLRKDNRKDILSTPKVVQTSLSQRQSLERGIIDNNRSNKLSGLRNSPVKMSHDMGKGTRVK